MPAALHLRHGCGQEDIQVQAQLEGRVEHRTLRPPSSSDTRWFHLFVPITCLASKPELKTAVAGKLEEIGMTLMPDEKDFKCIKPEIGKYHANF